MSEIYAVGIKINAQDNSVLGDKVEFQPGCCLGSAVELSSGSARNQLTFGTSKAVNAVTIDSGAISAGGTITVGNTTNPNPVNNSSNMYFNFNVVGTAQAVQWFGGGATILGGTSSPSAGQCTAANLGGLYLRNQGPGASGIVYVCTAAATWTAVTVP